MRTTTFKTGNNFRGTVKRWAKIGSTKHFATFCLLEWSKDVLNEAGIMYLTDKTERVKIAKNGQFIKKGIGEFQIEESQVITVKSK